MTKDTYFQQLIWIIPMLIIDIIIPIVTFIPKLRKKEKFKIDGGIIAFVITVIVFNCLLSYIIGIVAYINIRLNEMPTHSYGVIWIISFAILSAIESALCYFYVKREPKVSMTVSMSPNDYKELILDAEKGAKTIWLMPKRIHVMFKSQAFIHYIAENRFGVGSTYIQAYENEHIVRKATLYQGLNNGLVIHELHNKNELISYITRKTHNGIENIEKEYFVEMLNEWKRVLEQFPNNYFVRLTDENVPLKYELIDSKKMVMHESVGKNSKDRLNAIFVENPMIVKKISGDFLQIWERVPSDYRNNNLIIKFIDEDLLPLLT